MAFFVRAVGAGVAVVLILAAVGATERVEVELVVLWGAAWGELEGETGVSRLLAELPWVRENVVFTGGVVWAPEEMLVVSHVAVTLLVGGVPGGSI